MTSPFNTSSIPHHTHLKNKELQPPHSTASSAKAHDTRQPHEPQSSPHTQTGSYNPLFAVVPQRHCFNPRSRVGSDVFLGHQYTLDQQGFNPRSHVGRDKTIVGRALRDNGFNPRSHVGSDLATQTLLRDLACFNPRSHVGSDNTSSFLMNTLTKFQSTLPRGERHMQRIILAYGQVFQSTLPRGERP